MNSPQRSSQTDRERRLESLLQIAAEYEPETAMPQGLEARALAGRAPKRPVIALPWQPLAVVTGFALTVGVLWLAFSFRHKPEPANVRQTASLPAARSAYSAYGAERTIPDRTHHSKSSQAAFSNRMMNVAISAPVKQSMHSRPAGRLSLQAKGFNPSPARYQAAQVKQIEPKKKTIYPSTRPGFAEKQPVWRTEVVETETVGFAAPALIATPNSNLHTLTVTPAVVSFPVQEGDIFCAVPISSPEEDAAPPFPMKSGETHENH